MSTQHSQHKPYDEQTFPLAPNQKFGLVVSNWNSEITEALCKGATEVFKTCGVAENNILIHAVPGSFELPLAAQWLIEKHEPDAVICIGSVVRGETAHFDYVCQAVAQGVKDVALNTGVPTLFCVLTDDNLSQARDRSGGKLGNKGTDAALAALEMAELRDRLKR